MNKVINVALLSLLLVLVNSIDIWLKSKNILVYLYSWDLSNT